VPGADPGEWEIDTWLMSCRVLGRQFEHFMLDRLIAAGRARGIRRLAGVYRKTAKNAQVADLFPRFGFAAVDVDGHDVGALRDVLTRVPLDSAKPTAVVCHTVKGKGITFAENNMAWHHQNKVTAQDAVRLLTALEAY